MTGTRIKEKATIIRDASNRLLELVNLWEAGKTEVPIVGSIPFSDAQKTFLKNAAKDYLADIKDQANTLVIP